MGLKRKKENIEHIDTNIVMRLITGDDPRSYEKAKTLISNQEKLFVLEDAAIMEVAYVLSGRIYNYSRKNIVTGIRYITEFDNICLNKGLIKDTLNLYLAHPKLSFVDCYLVAITSSSDEKPLWTLDRKLASQTKIAKLL